MRDQTCSSTGGWIAGLTGMVAFLAAGCGEKAPGPGAVGETPTFARDVAPIVFENCSYCHRPEQAAPFTLLDYADVSKRAKQIAEVVQSRYMPPWLPAPGFNHFQNERVLTEKQVATILAWVAAGAPEGNRAEQPAPPTFADDWYLGQPDLIVRMPEPYTIPADGPDIYRNFVIPIATDRVRYVKAMEFRPGNARVVHHAFLTVDRTAESQRLDLNDDGPGFGGIHLPLTGTVPDGQFFSWQPGKVPIGGDSRRAWPIQTNSWLVIQMHMQTTGKPETVQAEVGFKFTEETERDITFKLGLSSYALEMPPGATNFVAEDAFEVPVDVELLGILPHAHYLARRMHGLATLPDGTSRWLLNIDHWDFNWQGEYWYQEPIRLPKGTRVGMRFFYDNSTNNPANPSDPPRPVAYGLNSTDEMAELWMIFRLKTPEDQAQFNRAVVPKVARNIITYSGKILEKDPGDAQAWLRSGSAHLALGDAQQSTRCLRQALRYDPQLDEAHYYLGLIAFSMNDDAAAEAEFMEAIRINYQNFRAHGYLGLLYMRLGDLAKSEASFLEALKVNPNDDVARENLQLLKTAREQEIQVPAAEQP